MGAGVASTDAFRNIIVHPGHHYIGADSTDSAVQLTAGSAEAGRDRPDHQGAAGRGTAGPERYD